MKNFTVIHLLLFVLLMLVYQCTQAQDFVITQKGDTLYGKVKPFPSPVDPRVQISVEGQPKKNLRVVETRGFRYKNEMFVPVKLHDRYVFMKVLRPGYLTLYAHQLDNQLTYDGRYFGRLDGTGMEVPNLTFKKAVARYLADCPNVTAKLESGELGRKDLEKIVDEYNGCIDKTSLNTVTQVRQIGAWDLLEEKVKNKKDLATKDDALEMIKEIKSKIKRGEKTPSFIIDGLKNALANAGMDSELQNALNELKN